MRNIFSDIFHYRDLDNFTDFKNVYPIIEITGGCIAKCPFCPTSKSYGSKKNFLNPSLFDKIINHFKEENLITDGQVLQLYNYGEPFIHPQLNKIIEIAAKNGHTVGFSSNFIKFPDIDKENYKHINFIVFSLSGLSEESYRPIYGADITKVLRNFNKFLQNRVLYNPNIQVMVNWINYKIDENKIAEAKAYFEKRNCTFRSITAFINDTDNMMKLITNKFNTDELKDIHSILDTQPCLDKIKGFRDDTSYECQQILKTIVVNEFGNLLGCTETSKQHHLGRFLFLNKKEIFLRKIKYSRNKNCQKCLKLGLAKFIDKGLVN